MKSVSVSEFKTHCLRLVEEVSQSGEALRITKRGRPLVIVSASETNEVIDWTPGAFRDSIKIVGDLDDLGVNWEALA